MVKGVSIKFQSYSETIPKLLELIKFGDELKKHEKIILKPDLGLGEEEGTNILFVAEVLKFCVEHKNPGSEIFIAEGADGKDTSELFEEEGYKELAEKYGIGLIDLNKTETESVQDGNFLEFSEIFYPKILRESFVISLPKIKPDEKYGFLGSLANMRGAFPGKHYKGLFSNKKKKIEAIHPKYQIHDINVCKMPDFMIGDASHKGVILAGQALDMDKQATKLYQLDWKEIDHLRMLEESFYNPETSHV